jgi:transposase
MTRAGEAPEVVLEAAYGWYWAADALAELGATVHLAHPLGVKMFGLRRVKNDERDAADLADLLRMGRLPEAWIAPPATRELRGWVRHRAKLVALRSGLRCQIHAVLAGAGVQVPMSDLFGASGRELLTTAALTVESRSRVESLLRIIGALDFEIDLYTKLVASRLRTDPGYHAIQAIPGVGPVLAAVFVAEIGDITRFHRPAECTAAALRNAALRNKALGWCVGPRSRPCNACPRAPGWGSVATASPSAVATTSASWPPPAT